MAKIRNLYYLIQIYFLLFFYERGFTCSESGCKYSAVYSNFANDSEKFFILFCKRLNMCLVRGVRCWMKGVGVFAEVRGYSFI